PDSYPPIVPSVHPFTIQIAQEDIDDVRRRLVATRWPEPIPGTGWDYGTAVEWLRDICGYWADGFDWRAQEAYLNTFPQVVVRVGGLDIHFVHVPGKGPSPMPLTATPGWPSPFFDLHTVI